LDGDHSPSLKVTVPGFGEDVYRVLDPRQTKEESVARIRKSLEAFING
jgi:citrate synthase